MGWEYYAKPLMVVNAESIFLEVDLGFHVRKQLNCRLYGINSPLITSRSAKTRDKAALARSRLRDLIDAASARSSSEYPLLIETFRDPRDKYGRWLVTIYCNQIVGGDPDTSVNEILITEGLATRHLT